MSFVLDDHVPTTSTTLRPPAPSSSELPRERLVRLVGSRPRSRHARVRLRRGGHDLAARDLGDCCDAGWSVGGLVRPRSVRRRSRAAVGGHPRGPARHRWISAHRLTDPVAVDSVAWLARRTSTAFQLVLASRSDPRSVWHDCGWRVGSVSCVMRTWSSPRRRRRPTSRAKGSSCRPPASARCSQGPRVGSQGCGSRRSRWPGARTVAT